MKIHVVSAVIVLDSRVLLGLRSASKTSFPGAWDFLGGHVEANETPSEAVVRECLEEAGIIIEEFYEYPTMCILEDMILHCFLVTRFSGLPMNTAPDEHDHLAWFTFAEARKLKLAIPEMLEEIMAHQKMAGD